MTELGGELSNRILHRADAEHADIGCGSYAGKLHQHNRNGRDSAETPHCVFSSEVPDVRDHPSVPIPKFAHPRGTLKCELRNRRDTSKPMILMRTLDLKFLSELAAT
jgi:hypothetical protein